MKLQLAMFALPCALLLGCVDGHEHDGRPGHRGATLPNDAYYVGVPLPFRTVDDCVAAGPSGATCIHAVALCASGAYHVRHGDLVTSERYRLEGRHAVSAAGHGRHDGDDDGDDEVDEHSDRPAFDFDVEAGQLVQDPGGVTGLAWHPDVEGRWTSSAGAAVDCQPSQARGQALLSPLVVGHDRQHPRRHLAYCWTAAEAATNRRLALL